MSNLNLNTELAALDLKRRNFRQQMTDEEKKKFSTYLMLKYSASVEGNPDLQAYYLMATNENVNKHFFDLKQHPELQWLCCTTVSPGMGKQRHYWFNGFAKKSADDKYIDKLTKAVSEKLPNYKESDIDLWIELVGIEEVEQWILSFGDQLPKKK